MKTFRQFLEESKNPNILFEMSTVCKKSDGFGFILTINSDDHDPAHMHMFDLNDKLITKILIPTNKPNTISDIKIYKGSQDINNELKKSILQWFKGKNKLGINNWLRCVDIWNTYRGD